MSLPTPYYDCDGITIYHGDCREILPHLPKVDLVLTDPPYGIGFSGYLSHDDEGGNAYVDLIKCLTPFPRIVLQYPEETAKYLVPLWGGMAQTYLWCYNSNTARQSRMFSSWDVNMDFSKVKQPSKNPTDKRVKEWVSCYDWTTEFQQVKNISCEKTDHPCQVPEKLMRRVIGFTDAETITDPFMGSGTTLVAAKQLHRKAIGIEIEEKYCEIAVKRLGQGVLPI